jgi:hypothetical protein
MFRTVGEGEYLASNADLDIEFRVSRLRYERHELVGELTVCCGIPGARVVDVDDGSQILSASTMNFSSAQTRQTRSKLLAERSRARQLDWFGMVEELCQRVLAAERRGHPAVVLSQVPAPAPDDTVSVEGFTIPRAHATILFGDGGTAKSLLSLYAGGKLEAHGERVALFDWELDAATHRGRLERLFGPLCMPSIRYVRCERPLVHEIDRIRRVIQDEEITFGVFDSVGFACDGPPEAAESALNYFRAWRQLRIGGLHIAHISKAENGDQRPFGSAFWHNSARATWYVKQATNEPGSLTIGLINRKANLGPLQPALAYTFSFDAQRTTLTRVNASTVDELVDSVPLWQRIKQTLKTGPQTLAAIADELDAKVDTVEKAVKRKSQVFTKVSSEDGIYRIALVERRVA